MVRSNWLGPEYGNLEGAKVPDWNKKKSVILTVILKKILKGF